MNNANWGNNAPERRQQIKAPYVQLDYKKLFWTIVGAIITASVIMTFVGFIFVSLATGALFNALTSSINQQAEKVTLDFMPPSVVSKYNERKVQAITSTLNGSSREKANAQRIQAQTCAFWKAAYNNENSDKHYQRVIENCPEYQKNGL